MSKNFIVLLFIMALPVLTFAFDDNSDNPWSMSIEKLTTQLKKEPDNIFLFYARGTKYRDIGNKTQALNDFNTAISLCNDREKIEGRDVELAQQKKGSCFALKGLIQKAVREIEGANETVYQILNLTKKIEQNPTHAMNYYDRACEYGHAGDKFNGLKDLNKALQLCEGGKASGVICKNFIPFVKRAIETMKNKGVCWSPE